MDRNLGRPRFVRSLVCFRLMANCPREGSMTPLVVFLIGIAVIVVIVAGVVVWLERKKPM